MCPASITSKGFGSSRKEIRLDDLKGIQVYDPAPGMGCTHYISMGRGVLTKGVLFSESVWNGGMFHCKKSGKGFKYTCLVGEFNFR